MSQTSRSTSERRGPLRGMLRTHPRSGDTDSDQLRSSFSHQPKVAEAPRLPWVQVEKGYNPDGVASAGLRVMLRTHPRSGESDVDCVASSPSGRGTR